MCSCVFRDGRLRERDQILAIDGQPIEISHQETIRILQGARGLVELIVARGAIPQQPDPVITEPHVEPQSNVHTENTPADMVVSGISQRHQTCDIITQPLSYFTDLDEIFFRNSEPRHTDQV